jgi:hypothetical protein
MSSLNDGLAVICKDVPMYYFKDIIHVWAHEESGTDEILPNPS